MAAAPAPPRWVMRHIGTQPADDPPTVDVYGVDLHVGSIIVQALPDNTIEVHVILRLDEYPGRCIGAGDHARIAYAEDGWRHTCADHEKFHVREEEQ